ncbi:hypothetical protein LTR72_012228 [Exophiala xenobiotica]|nr:hypothetical protein LTR72_012228 [Exophiala xenobiotica]
MHNDTQDGYDRRNDDEGEDEDDRTAIRDSDPDSESETRLIGEVDEEDLDASEVTSLREQLYEFFPERKCHNGEPTYGSIYLSRREDTGRAEGKNDDEWSGGEIVRGEIDEEHLMGERIVEQIDDLMGKEHMVLEVDRRAVLEQTADGTENVEVLTLKSDLCKLVFPDSLRKGIGEMM